MFTLKIVRPVENDLLQFRKYVIYSWDWSCILKILVRAILGIYFKNSSTKLHFWSLIYVNLLVSRISKRIFQKPNRTQKPQLRSFIAKISNWHCLSEIPNHWLMDDPQFVAQCNKTHWKPKLKKLFDCQLHALLWEKLTLKCAFIGSNLSTEKKTQ